MSTEKTVTLDTNILPAEDIIALCGKLGWAVAIVTVTERESEGCDFQPSLELFEKAVEDGIWDESKWDHSLWGSRETESEFNKVLAIISNGSFPRDRHTLSSGQRRQLRDAMIFHAHARDHRDILVTNDTRAFVGGGRSERLECEFRTRIMTRDEFLQFEQMLSEGLLTPRSTQ